MPITDPTPPTRQELAEIFKGNQRLIRAFEKIFELVPGEFNSQEDRIEEVAISSGSAQAKADQAVAETVVLWDELEAVQLAPIAERPAEAEFNEVLRLAPVDEPYTPPRYGLFTRTTDDTLAAASTAEVIDFDTEDLSFGVTIDGTNASRIVVDREGVYDFGATLQAQSTTASTKILWFWFRLNGADVAQSATKETLGTADDRDTLRLSRLFSLAAGDYVEIAWAADSTDVALDAEAASAFAPAVPACILSVKQIK